MNDFRLLYSSFMELPLCFTEEDLISIVLICFVLFVTGEGAFSNFYLAV
jgi:hypothetical protein